MNISRKDFFRQGLLSVVKTARDLVGTLSPASDPAAASDKPAFPEKTNPDLVAEPFNERCLARNCGCFACSECCKAQAILVVPWVGIKIDETACTGCGQCEYVCPVEPKAVILAPRRATAKN
jgi:Pyruvate/2-oxoacid:ferredoxin oxidoreductase delta subunit